MQFPRNTALIGFLQGALPALFSSLIRAVCSDSGASSWLFPINLQVGRRNLGRILAVSE